VHFHILYLDGVYVLDNASRYDSPLTFHDLPTPTRAETTEIAGCIADRVEVVLRKHGRSLEPDADDSEPTEVQLEHPALAACYGAAAMGVEVGGDRAGQPTLRLMSGDGTGSARDTELPDLPVAEVDWPPSAPRLTGARRPSTFVESSSKLDLVHSGSGDQSVKTHAFVA
jgi:hypothetical protein